jgi:hypothetical protein
MKTAELTAHDVEQIIQNQPHIEIAYEAGCQLSYSIASRRYELDPGTALGQSFDDPAEAAEAFNRAVARAR